MDQYFILGSCVTRDSFGDGRSPQLVDYSARAPLGSIFSSTPEVPPPDFTKLSSAFQRRMVEGDWNKDLPNRLSESDYDYLLVDLIDERFDLIEIDEALVSSSNEFRATGFATEQYSKHRFGSPKHVKAFQQGLASLVDLVGADRIVVSEVYWAEVLEDGRPTGDARYIQAANTNLSALYAIVRNFPVNWIKFPPELSVGATEHKWGISPFHYIDEFYKFYQKALAERAFSTIHK